MKPTRIVAALLAAATLAPAAGAGGVVEANPLVNGDFDTGIVIGGITPARLVLDRCVGVGHQVFDPLFSPWGATVLSLANDAANDPSTLGPAAAEEGFAEAMTGYPVATARAAAADPSTVPRCDHREIAEVNAWNAAHDRAIGWSSDPGTRFVDFADDGDVEVVIPTVPQEHEHSLWQSFASASQAFSADFETLQFALEAGTPGPGASVQVGLALSPAYMQHPFVGVFLEGAVHFSASDLAPDTDGVVRLSPVAEGSIACPAGYRPCEEYRAEFDVADDAGKARILRQARIVETSFWSFHSPAGPVVIDDIAYVGARTAAEAQPNPGNV